MLNCDIIYIAVICTAYKDLYKKKLFFNKMLLCINTFYTVLYLIY